MSVRRAFSGEAHGRPRVHIRVENGVLAVGSSDGRIRHRFALVTPGFPLSGEAQERPEWPF
eukprot:11176750-Lingulodinium_polyedra.AAC.1